MSVYVDHPIPCLTTRRWPHKKSCHLFADTIEELHGFAERIGLKRAWFHDHEILPHYDLTKNKRREAVAVGAVPVERTFVSAFMAMKRKRKYAR